MNRVDRHVLALTLATVAVLASLVGFFYWPRVPTLNALTTTLNGAESDEPRDDEPRSATNTSSESTAFHDVTDRSGITVHHHQTDEIVDIRHVMAPGVACGDLNGDGLPDIVLPGPGRDGTAPVGDVVYFNQGSMRFEREFDGGFTVATNAPGMGAYLIDFDLDGDLDIHITALGPNRFYRNDGAGHFVECAATLGLDDPRWSTGAAWADADGDGDPDLYVANYVRFDPSRIAGAAGVRQDRAEPPAFNPFVFGAEADALLRNDKATTFVDVTETSGVACAPGKGMGVIFADLNGDQRPDLFVVNDVSDDLLFINDGDMHFSDCSVAAGVADPRGGMGVSLADYNCDGAPDLFVSHWQDESNALYRNNVSHGLATAIFDDVTIETTISRAGIGLTGWGVAWGDFDLDGRIDLLVVNGYTSPAAADRTQCIGQPPTLFMQQAGGRFDNRASEMGLDALSAFAARGAVAADLDNDGDLDLVIATNHGPLKVFENVQTGGNWLKVIPTAGLLTGTRVTIRLDSQSRTQEMTVGTSYLCSAPTIAHFGIGSAQKVTSVRVTWPDGNVTQFNDVPANQNLNVKYTP